MRVSHGTYRGMIALVAVAGAFVLAMVRLLLEGNADIPTWVGTLVGSIVAFYFGERAAVVASRNGADDGHSHPRRRESDKQ